MLIKFVKQPGMPQWQGYGGLWRDGRTEDVPDGIALRLLGLYKSPFIKVDGKAAESPSNKMMPGAPANKVDGQGQGAGEGNGAGQSQDGQGQGADGQQGQTTASNQAQGHSAGEADPRPVRQDDESKGDYKKRLREWEERQKK